MKNILPRLTSLVVVMAALALAVTRHHNGAANAQTQQAGAEQGAAAPSPYNTPAAVPPAAMAAAAAAAATPSIGDQLLSHAAARLERRASVTARMRHQAFINGKQLYGIGNYWQQGAADELRVRLELELAGQDTSLLQVSNGYYLWLERNLPTGRVVTTVNLRELRADPSLSAANLDAPEPGTATWSQSEMIAFTGGLPAMLASLETNFSFMPPQAMRLAAQTSVPNSASIPVFAVVGHWRPEKLAALVSKSEEVKVDSGDSARSGSPLSTLHSQLASLPSRFPQEVLLLVGQGDLFPYRIEYRRLETPPESSDGLPIPYQLSANPMVVIEFIDVAFDTPIAAGQFEYSPGEAEFSDQTAEIIERLRASRDQLAERPTKAHK
jgi:hypothetical protein